MTPITKSKQQNFIQKLRNFGVIYPQKKRPEEYNVVHPKTVDTSIYPIWTLTKIMTYLRTYCFVLLGQDD